MLNPGLRDVLPWWSSLLRNPVERSTWFHGDLPVAICTDAAGCGHLGVVIFDGEGRIESPLHAPGWMRGGDIYDLEMCASAFGFRLTDELFPERSIILRGDNRGTAQTRAKGACRALVSSHMCDAFWNLAESYPIFVRIEAVPGEINPADPPPRDCAACARPHAVSTRRCVVPNVLSRISHSRESNTQSQFPLPSGTGGMANSLECPSAVTESQ